jgi:flagellar hook-length control protein FliK
MMDASRLSAFSLASTASLTPSPASTASAGDAASAASATLGGAGGGALGFAQWLAAWAPETATGTASAAGAAVPAATPEAVTTTGSVTGGPAPADAGQPWSDPRAFVRLDLPNVRSPAGASEGQPASASRPGDDGSSWAAGALAPCLQPLAGAAGGLPVDPAAAGLPVRSAGPIAGAAGTAPEVGPDEVAGAAGADPRQAGTDPASGDDDAPVPSGPDAATVAAWLWPPAASPAPVVAPGAEAGGGRSDSVAAAPMSAASTVSAPASTGSPLRAEPDHGHDSRNDGQTAQSLQDIAATTSDTVAAVSASDATGLAVAGLGASLAPSAVHTVVPPAIEVAVATPVMADRFGDEVSMHLAQHVSRMTGETQEVVLHLHPAEMGPVSVGIELRGGVATVEFGAAQAVTRQQLEQSLPSLAQALRDEGLVLGQGLVHDRPASGGSGQRRRGENQFSIGAISRTAGRSGGSIDEMPGSIVPGLAGRRGRIDLTA